MDVAGGLGFPGCDELEKRARNFVGETRAEIS